MMLTLWGNAYETFDFEGTSILVHNGVINEFNGAKTINCTKNTLFWHKPEMEDAKKLESWYSCELKKLNEN